MFALLVRFELLPDSHREFDELVRQTLAAIAAHEPGTSVYLSHRRADHPDERVFYECYADRDAFDAHEMSSHTRRFLAERGQYLAAEPEVWWLSAEGGVVAGRPINGPND
ncbi:MAG: antibiotic biosynthesis monooxygenase [Actinomycetota bacterium]|nr:antibiotic biosynthesis monooxygenase [Actinomycetota bacterium]